MPVSLELLQNCKEEYELNLVQYNKMQSYYDGKTDALANYQMVTERANNKISNNMLQKFINEEAAYCVGNKITYSSYANDPDIIEDVRVNTIHWSEKHDRELCKEALIFNEAYELYYINTDGLFSSIILTPNDSYVLRDDIGNVVLVIRFFMKKFDLITRYADVYEGNTITHYTVEGSNFVQYGTVDTTIFSRVPVSVCNIGTIYESLFNNIKGAQDGYETITSDLINEISDMRNAFLVLTNCQVEDDDLGKMKQLGVMQLPNKDSSAQFLIKTLSDTFIQNAMTTLRENMYELSNHINHNEKLSSNTSSLAMKNRLIGLQQKCTNNVQAVQDCIKLRLQFLFEYLKVKQNKSYSYADIDIKLTPNIPSDDLMMAQILSQLNGKVSTKTGIKQLSFVSNVDAEMELLADENKANSVGGALLNGGV
ncbi:phage portal protein [Desulfosporosinus metallidurans]|uniref:Portal protein, phage associated n=1 Tax=Desulfosporosinus metallidurans TaxID=1888891 RepID=A0A1Q8QJN9_9FIRM|nr:phage portal protein [Desulfosporosinus metallidurans]OLN27536.1 Portal protein, phage associated [Desulfosporosinus metallidurans]